MSDDNRNVDRDDATFLRAALLIGVVRPEAAIAWADRIIERDHDVDPHVIELSLTSADDFSAVRHALYPLANPTESTEIVRRLLTVIAQDFVNGRRNAMDTLRVLHQMRRLIPVPDEYKAELTAVEMSHMLASAGVEGRLETAEARLHSWLKEFVS